MPDFKDFLDTLAERIASLAVRSLKDFRGAVTKDGKAFLEKAKHDLERWTALLEGGQLTRDEFEWLVKGEKDLAELAALKPGGADEGAVGQVQGVAGRSGNRDSGRGVPLRGE